MVSIKLNDIKSMSLITLFLGDINIFSFRFKDWLVFKLKSCL
jgi:hypothetical protein